MIDRGLATFTLDTGKCPKWLFDRMVKLGRHITYTIVQEYGPEEFVRRVADPVWFQSLGTVLAFDWNASGLTTVLTGALKEAIYGAEDYFGFYIAGGKGKTSRKTPDQIIEKSQIAGLDSKYANQLVYNSKMSAKVDSSLVQDGFQLYHHVFFFTKKGTWAVVQQGMNQQNQTARRYHWYSEKITDMVCEPQFGIASQTKNITLDLSSKKSIKTRDLSVEFIDAGYKSLMKDIAILRKHSSSLSKMIKIEKTSGVTGTGSPEVKNNIQQLTLLELYDPHFTTHPVVNENFSKSKYLEKILWKIVDEKPKSYEELLSKKGVGPKTVRALSLVAEVIYGASPSYEDPARYSFAHGGKDTIPFPVDRKTYDKTIEFFRKVVNKTKLNKGTKNQILKRLI